MTTPVLKLARVSRRHADAERVFTLMVDSFCMGPSTRAAVVGPSGAGKSTLLDMLGLALSPTTAGTFKIGAGDITEVDIAALWADGAVEALADVRRQYFGYVLQSGGLLPFLNVEENIALPMRFNGGIDAARLDLLLRRLGLERQRRARLSDLSFGQRQRAAVARAVAHRPAFILADEPTAALDPRTADQVMELLVELSVEEERGLVVVSHDHNLLRTYPFAFWVIDGEVANGVHEARLLAETPAAGHA